MKKLLCLGLLLGTSMTYAGNPNCIHFNIKIKNNTPFSCQLVALQFKHATSADWEHLPLLIQPGAESLPFDIKQSSDYKPKVTLSYTCGEGRSITIQSTQTACYHYTKETSGKVIASDNMDATFDANNSDYFAGKAGEINWILH